jgi:hypothetical protein
LFALGMWYNFDRRNEPSSSEEMETTLTKIKNLERIYISGYGDDFMDRALDKLLAQQRTEDEASLRVLQADLAELEQRYAMRSDEFTQRYQNGIMGDAVDFVEWNALYRMFTKVQNRLSLLQG